MSDEKPLSDLEKFIQTINKPLSNLSKDDSTSKYVDFHEMKKHYESLKDFKAIEGDYEGEK